MQTPPVTSERPKKKRTLVLGLLLLAAAASCSLFGGGETAGTASGDGSAHPEEGSQPVGVQGGTLTLDRQ